MRRLMPFFLALLLALGHAANAQQDANEVYKKAMELYRAQQYAEALPYFKKALDLAETRYGEDSPLLSLDLNNLGEIYRLLNQPAQAEPLFKRAIRLDETIGADNPGLATSLNNLALLYRNQKRFDEAEPLYRRAIDIIEKAMGTTHPDLARSLNNLAMLYREQGDAAKARPLQERAVAIAEKGLGEEHPTSKQLRRNLELLGKPPTEVAMVEAPEAVPLPPSPSKDGLVLPNPTGALPPPGADRRAALPPAPAPPVAPAASPRAAPARPVAALPPRPPAPPSPGARPKPSAPLKPLTAPLRPPPAGTGRWAVHLVSVRDPAQVASEWRRLVRLNPILASLPLRQTERIEVAGKGAFYRVAGGEFATRAEAQAVCDKLKAAGTYCTLSNPP